jgi:hypothetical protein
MQEHRNAASSRPMLKLCFLIDLSFNRTAIEGIYTEMYLVTNVITKIMTAANTIFDLFE